MSVDSPESRDSNATRFFQIHPFVGEILRSFTGTELRRINVALMGKTTNAVAAKDRSISPTNGWIWTNRVALES